VQPSLVVAGVGAGIPRPACVEFGRAVRAAAATTGRRVGFVASADLAHAHDPDGPFGFEDAAEECDRTVADALRSGDLSPLLQLDETMVFRSRTEAIEPLLALHGVVDGHPVRADVISYEVPTYFGMLCAEYTPEP